MWNKKKCSCVCTSFYEHHCKAENKLMDPKTCACKDPMKSTAPRPGKWKYTYLWKYFLLEDLYFQWTSHYHKRLGQFQKIVSEIWGVEVIVKGFIDLWKKPKLWEFLLIHDLWWKFFISYRVHDLCGIQSPCCFSCSCNSSDYMFNYLPLVPLSLSQISIWILWKTEWVNQ